jgi:hypothetical protein
MKIQPKVISMMMMHMNRISLEKIQNIGAYGHVHHGYLFGNRTNVFVRHKKEKYSSLLSIFSLTINSYFVNSQQSFFFDRISVFVHDSTVSHEVFEF